MVEEKSISKQVKHNKQDRGQGDIKVDTKLPEKESNVVAVQEEGEDQSNQEMSTSEAREKVTHARDETKKATKQTKKKKQKKNNANTSATTDTDVGKIKNVDEPQPERSSHVDESDSNDDNDDDDDDEDDAELLAAAAAWADQNEGETKVDEAPANTTTTTTSLTPPTDLSLHITQLPYDTNELDLRRLFAEHGCAITSIRLVYDRDDKGRKTVFRGVAFVDLLNPTSYDKALSLNRKSTIRGRKLNIRPTRSKQELATIVTRTREVVQEKIRQQKNQDQSNTDPTRSSSTSNKKVDKKTKKKEKKREQKEKVKAAKKSQKDSKHKSAAKDANGDTTKEEHKMTKKERNRRAAIILGLKKGKKG